MFRAPARTVALGSAIALFALLCALPIVWMLGVSFVGSDGRAGLGNYARLFVGPRERQLMLNSALLGAGASLLATLIGGASGIAFGAVGLPVETPAANRAGRAAGDSPLHSGVGVDLHRRAGRVDDAVVRA